MKKLIGLGLSLFAFSGVVNALDVGVGVKVGTVGAGLEVSVALTDTINLRAALTSFDIDGEDETLSVGDDNAEVDIDAELSADYGANALLVDWYPFDGTFHLTAGMVKNNGEVDITGTLIGSGSIDGQLINAGDLGEMTGEVSLGDSYQPYLGIGWGRKAGREPGFAVSLEIGVALLDPEVDLEARVNAGGNFASQAELDATLRDAEKDAEDELDDFEIFPVLSLGINYAF
jgi:hypothetical protein